MELQRRVLLLTWTFFLTFDIVINAEASQCSEETTPKNKKIKELFKNLNNTYLYRKDTKSSNETSLVGKPTRCLWMLWTTEANVSTASVFLTYKDEMNETIVDILSVKSECKNTLEFTFTDVDLEEFRDRKVKYKVLSTNSSCSILKKPKARSGKCAYWVLYTGGGGKVAKWCKPPRNHTGDVEIHTLKQPGRCKEKPVTIPPGVYTLKPE
uniref:Putative secreted protein n=1 Tax=Ixodes ricinus TaxID=34613 RepID=A0A090X9K1_IXORI